MLIHPASFLSFDSIVLCGNGMCITRQVVVHTYYFPQTGHSWQSDLCFNAGSLWRLQVHQAVAPWNRIETDNEILAATGLMFRSLFSAILVYRMIYRSIASVLRLFRICTWVRWFLGPLYAMKHGCSHGCWFLTQNQGVWCNSIKTEWAGTKNGFRHAYFCFGVFWWRKTCYIRSDLVVCLVRY